VSRPAGRIVVVGLGPGDPDLVSAGAASAIGSVQRRYLRTRRHPSAHLVEPATSFDDLYEHAGSMAEVYGGIVAELVAATAEHGEVLYAVPGSPFVAERTVELLRATAGLELVVVPSVSFLDLAWARLGIDPMELGVRLVDGHRFATEAAGSAGPLLVGQCDSRMVMSEMKLSVDDGPRVTVLQRLGLPDEKVFEVEWADIDREVDPDHLTCMWVPELASPVAAELTRFAELVRTLRAGCPWDREQTHQSLTRHLLEETYEVLDAIAALDTEEGYAHLEEELGDLLFQVAFHATLAAEAGEFDLSDVARGIHDKLVERHPHVFGPPGTPVPNWEEQKRLAKGRSSVMDGVPDGLPSLLYAYKVQSKAASVGFDWADAAGAREKISEELAELDAEISDPEAAAGRVSDELGDVLFSLVNVARHLGVDPETALREASVKFRRRFVAMEALAAERGTPVDDALWDQVKAAEAG
jgi:tetrapyrrole methylase family protein/MazG family protein